MMFILIFVEDAKIKKRQQTTVNSQQIFLKTENLKN